MQTNNSSTTDKNIFSEPPKNNPAYTGRQGQRQGPGQEAKQVPGQSTSSRPSESRQIISEIETQKAAIRFMSNAEMDRMINALWDALDEEINSARDLTRTTGSGPALGQQLNNLNNDWHVLAQKLNEMAMRESQRSVYPMNSRIKDKKELCLKMMDMMKDLLLMKSMMESKSNAITIATTPTPKGYISNPMKQVAPWMPKRMQKIMIRTRQKMLMSMGYPPEEAMQESKRGYGGEDTGLTGQSKYSEEPIQKPYPEQVASQVVTSNRKPLNPDEYDVLVAAPKEAKEKSNGSQLNGGYDSSKGASKLKDVRTLMRMMKHVLDVTDRKSYGDGSNDDAKSQMSSTGPRYERQPKVQKISNGYTKPLSAREMSITKIRYSLRPQQSSTSTVRRFEEKPKSGSSRVPRGYLRTSTKLSRRRQHSVMQDGYSQQRKPVPYALMSKRTSRGGMTNKGQSGYREMSEISRDYNQGKKTDSSFKQLSQKLPGYLKPSYGHMIQEKPNFDQSRGTDKRVDQGASSPKPKASVSDNTPTVYLPKASSKS